MTERKMDINALCSFLANRLNNSRARLVGIDGAGGSGKSTLGRLLVANWPGVTIIQMDDFYLPTSRRHSVPEPGQNFDRERLRSEVLDPITEGGVARYQRYDWDRDELAEWHEVPAGGTVVVEGSYSTSKPLRDYYSTAIWVQAAYETRLRRGVERDGESMRDVWVKSWMPAEDRYLQAERPDLHADIVLDGGGVDDAESAFLVVRAPSGLQ